jgi:hypothetical protein
MREKRNGDRGSAGAAQKRVFLVFWFCFLVSQMKKRKNKCRGVEKTEGRGQNFVQLGSSGGPALASFSLQL